MPQNEAAAAIDPIAGGSFSRLLFSDLEPEDTDHHHPPNTFTFSANKKTPKMLCFGAVSLTPDNSATNNNSSSPVSVTTTTSLSSNSNIKRNMGSDYYQPVVLPTATEATPPPVRTTGRTNKKMRIENTPPASHAKVKKKEKLGERIAALQQMVSPYGKTDTASVLHEAMGYIKFLQEQVQVLCSPYLQRVLPTHIEGEEDKGRERKKELRTRGLCLVPVECTLHVAESNGADLWSPAMGPRHGSTALH
ncbi:putative transcription factor bHLH family [Helianthus anomalus]